MPPDAPALILPFREIDLGSLPRVGGKNASLGELLRTFAPAGIHVPDGFAITALALGGVNVEIGQIRGARLIDGFRGAPPCDREALVDVLLRVSRLAMDLPEIAELDLNPLMALPAGRGACVVDARVRVRAAATTTAGAAT